MVAGDFFPRNVVVRMTEPEETVGSDDDLLRVEVDLLRNESCAQDEGGKQGGGCLEGFDHRQFLASSEVVPAIPALFCRRLGNLIAIGTGFPGHPTTAGMADLSLVRHLAATFGTRFH